LPGLHVGGGKGPEHNAFHAAARASRTPGRHRMAEKQARPC
jgi:hypothetical protein